MPETTTFNNNGLTPQQQQIVDKMNSIKSGIGDKAAANYRKGNQFPRAQQAGQAGFDKVLEQLNSGPTDEQSALLQEIVDKRFASGASAIQRHSERLSTMLSGSAAARGLGKSSVGLGRQALLGESVIEQLAGLRGNLEAGAAQQAFNIPFQNAQVHLAAQQGVTQNNQFVQSQYQNQQQFDASQSGGFDLSSVVGAGFGAVAGPVGAYVGKQITGGGRQAAPGTNIAPSSNPNGFQFPS